MFEIFIKIYLYIYVFVWIKLNFFGLMKLCKLIKVKLESFGIVYNLLVVFLLNCVIFFYISNLRILWILVNRKGKKMFVIDFFILFCIVFVYYMWMV